MRWELPAPREKPGLATRMRRERGQRFSGELFYRRIDGMRDTRSSLPSVAEEELDLRFFDIPLFPVFQPLCPTWMIDESMFGVKDVRSDSVSELARPE
eukprot:2028319-Amphidinium_carterae.1